MRLKIDWSKPHSDNFDSSISKYKRYLREQGIREGTIEMYTGNVVCYLKFCKTDRPT